MFLVFVSDCFLALLQEEFTDKRHDFYSLVFCFIFKTEMPI